LKVNTPAATYVYCVVAAPRRPALRGVAKGPRGTGPVRLLAIEPGGESPRPASGARNRPLTLWLVVSDASGATYNAATLEKQLNDLNWVSRAALAHEAVVESFMKSPAVLPMKLFTLFASDESALANIRSQRPAIRASVKRVANHDEWGVRVIFNGSPAPVAPGTVASRPRQASGSGYLQGKKRLRDTRTELARRARRVASDLYDQMAGQASSGRRRAADELPVQGGPLLLDAAFLVPRSRASRFRALVRQAARSHRTQGYRVNLSGPWPPYSFLED
jgi:hypothetical protein